MAKKTESIKELADKLVSRDVQIQQLFNTNRELLEENEKLKGTTAWQKKCWGAVSLGMDRSMQNVLNNERRARVKNDEHAFVFGRGSGKFGVKMMWDLIAEEIGNIGGKIRTYDEERLENYPEEREREVNEAHKEALKINTEKKAG